MHQILLFFSKKFLARNQFFVFFELWQTLPEPTLVIIILLSSGVLSNSLSLFSCWFSLSCRRFGVTREKIFCRENITSFYFSLSRDHHHHSPAARDLRRVIFYSLSRRQQRTRERRLFLSARARVHPERERTFDRT